MKEKILTVINNLKEKLQNLKEKLQSNEKFAKVLEKVQIFVDKIRKQNKKESEKSSKIKRVIGRRFKRIFSLRSVSTFLAIVISVPAITFFVYAYWQDMQGEHHDEESVNRIINANLDYATLYLVKELRHRRIKRKHIRKLIKDLNGLDKKGRMHKFSPCEGVDEFMFGEESAPGNVVISKPESYEFEITSYSCSMEPLVTKSIKLKQPPRKRKSKKKKASHKKTTLEHSKPAHKEEETIDYTGNPAITRPVHNEQTKPVYKEEVKDKHTTQPAYTELDHNETVKDEHTTQPAHSEPAHKEEVKDNHTAQPVHSEPAHKEEVKDNHTTQPAHSEPVHH